MDDPRFGIVTIGQWRVVGYHFPERSHMLVVKYGDGFAIANSARQRLVLGDDDEILEFRTPESAEALIRAMIFGQHNPPRQTM